MSFTEFLTEMVGDEASRPKCGVLMSPNYPSHYPSSHDSTQTIEVAEGKTIHFAWESINTEPEYDYVQIVDGDGTNLTPKISGQASPPPGETPRFSSNTNIIHVKFHTNGDTEDWIRRTGWRLEWTEQE